IRHNVYLAAKEAVHNVLKHARATEVMFQVELEDHILTVTIRDDGCGIPLNDGHTGNGLANMKRRMNDIGGGCDVESVPGRGTTVRLRLMLTSADGIGMNPAVSHDATNSKRETHT
ncbi:MAG TPA: ATP-binding protein, partial [Verrucomicrobiae bacterium]|nr:ATP-binding protein [Verrucomicrobiae bacterium]